jgi:hypothetical protein
LRHVSAVGAATLVAGATFSVAASAQTGDVRPDQVASAAVVPTAPESASGTGPGEDGDDFFADRPTPSEEELAAAREESRGAAEAAADDAVRSFSGEGEDVPAPEPEPEPESAGTGGSSEPSGPSGSSGSTASASDGSARETARQMVLDEGWSESQFSECLEPLWEKESNWNHTAENTGSGAYGIPQALPGSKMSSHGDDWRTNPATQIAWGIDYIKGRYGDPCGAWTHSQANNWY